MTGVIALSSMFAFAGNGEKEIVQSNLEKIESSINDIQSLDNNEPKYMYKYWIWRTISDENNTGDTFGTFLMDSPVCETEVQMEAAKVFLKNYYQQYYSVAIWIVADVDYECD